MTGVESDEWGGRLSNRLNEFNQSSLGHGLAYLTDENSDPMFASLVARVPLLSVNAVAVVRIPINPSATAVVCLDHIQGRTFPPSALGALADEIVEVAELARYLTG